MEGNKLYFKWGKCSLGGNKVLIPCGRIKIFDERKD